MSERPYQFERFVRAVHRRLVVLRALERVGVCVLGGCAVLLVLVPVLLWRGEPSGPLVAVTLATAAVAGLAWGAVARPTALAAAAAVDRQFRLADLLSTAYALRARGARTVGMEDDFGGTVLALAEARCRGASPGAVVLHRLGARGWGGIGLATALVAGMSLLGPDDPRAAARAAAGTGPTSWREAETATNDDGGRAVGAAAAPDLRRDKPGTGGDDRDPLRSTVADMGKAPGAVESSSNGTGGGATDGAGAGAGRGAANGGSDTPREAGATASGANGGAGGVRATGGGGGATTTGSGDGGGGTSGGAATVRRPAPPWQTDQWPAARDAAGAAVRAGAVPERYRDLVRDYFEKP